MSTELSIIIAILGSIGTLFGIYNVVHNINSNKNKENSNDSYRWREFRCSAKKYK